MCIVDSVAVHGRIVNEAIGVERHNIVIEQACTRQLQYRWLRRVSVRVGWLQHNDRAPCCISAAGVLAAL